MPFAWRKTQNRTSGISAVADADATIGQARDFDAVAVAVTQRTFNPAGT
jgi:hypothetical protein